MMTTHRFGKIARLPLAIRSELNERLANNEPATSLVRWLNSEPVVQRVLEVQFDNWRINQQNISAWKQGGFRDWERFQESRLQVLSCLSEADELIGDLFDPDLVHGENGSFLDRMGDRMGLSLMVLFRETELKKKGPERTRDLLAIAREMSRLRQGDHRRQRMALVLQRREEEKLQEVDRQAKEAMACRIAERQLLIDDVSRFRAEFLFGLADGSLEPWRENKIRGFFLENAERIRQSGLSGLPEGDALARALEEIRARSAQEKAMAGEEDEPAEEEEDEEEYEDEEEEFEEEDEEGDEEDCEEEDDEDQDEEDEEDEADEEVEETEELEEDADEESETADGASKAQTTAPASEEKITNGSAQPAPATEEIKPSQGAKSLHQPPDFSPEKPA